MNRSAIQEYEKEIKLIDNNFMKFLETALLPLQQ